jgi:hypothetical protein
MAEHMESTKGDESSISDHIPNLKIEGPSGTIRFDANHESVANVFVQEWKAVKGKLSRTKLADLGEFPSLDFGCGKVGFPKRPEIDLPEPEEAPLLEPAEESTQ